MRRGRSGYTLAAPNDNRTCRTMRTPEPVQYILHATAPVPHLGIPAGATVVVTPGRDVCCVVDLPPNYGAILEALENGLLAPLTPDAAAVRPALRQYLALHPPGYAGEPPRPRLRLLPARRP